jgi:hypothetical protein
MYDKLTGGIVFDVDVPQAETKAVKPSRVYGLPVFRSFSPAKPFYQNESREAVMQMPA